MESKAYSRYKLFSQVSSKSDSYEICDDKNDNHKKPYKMNLDTLQLCRNIEDILSSFSILCPSYEASDNKCCEYLLYWLYGQVSNEKYDSFNIHWLYYKFHKLLEKKNLHRRKRIKCSANFLRIQNNKLLKNKKALYDFLDHYDIIKEELQANDTIMANKIPYCKYIGYIFHLFENMLMDHNSQSIQAYRHEMKNFKHKIIDKELDFIKTSCDTDSQISMFSIDTKTLHTLINEQLKNFKITDVSFRNKNLVNVRETNGQTSILSFIIKKYIFLSIYLNALYDIFWNIDSYQKYETYARGESNAYSTPSEYYCNHEEEYTVEGYDKIKDLCKLFISYLSFDNVQNDPSGNRRLGYLNYWLNKELKKNNYMSATDFMDVLNALLDNKFPAIANYNKFKYIVYNIDDEVIKEMDLLHHLHDYYNKIITESHDKDKCTEYFKKFIDLFEEGIHKYHVTKNNNFYIELLRLWSRYNAETDSPEFCKSNILPAFPKIETLHQKVKAASLSKTVESCKTFTDESVDNPQPWNKEYVKNYFFLKYILYWLI
ncbi:hypothetical protein PCYB_001640 [Plasmodium cynomolgi strain B]|uniref:CYIR protein n=1 Tax=Plasmodium cynomolgi (strain B) TaxID=1120755 RepID=K6UF36_PLACD|nr:hypothetical protein PCYB_001640 [Plasmodium cynomolgi strain B]GAB69416.1 hypothetical protein PCYB_001640 [Plasmodium cynomolgi strain B]